MSLQLLNMFGFIAVISLGSYMLHPRGIGEADFESTWILMESYSDSNSRRQVQHGLGEVPLKVKVLVKPIQGPYEGWMFEAGSSQQADDDLRWLYCGVLYTFDVSNVYLFAQVTGNSNTKTGKAFCIDPASWTSGSGTPTLYQADDSILVKVFAWKSSSFPVPEVDSQWLSVAVKESPYFIEVAHNTSSDLSLVQLQIRCEYRNGMVYAEGTGAASSPGLYRVNSLMTGLVFAYNDTHTRVWSPSANAPFLIGTADGFTSFCCCLEGEFRIRGWKTLGQRPQQFSITLNRLDEGIIPDMSDLKVNLKLWNPLTNYITVQVKALDGPNQGFVFPAIGQAHRNAYPSTTYGGVVFGYSEDKIRIFVPADETGTIIHVSPSWGQGRYNQSSNNVEIIVNIWSPGANSCAASVITTWQCTKSGRSCFPADNQLECISRCLYDLDCMAVTRLLDEDRCVFMDLNTVNNRTIEGLLGTEEGLILDTYSCK